MNKFKKYLIKDIDIKIIIEEDLPEVGWYIYIYNEKNEIIRDYLQDSFEVAVEVVEEYVGKKVTFVLLD